NWALTNEIASFLIYSLRNLKAGIDMGKLALALNPTSSDSWNTLADGLYECGRIEEAGNVYLHAERLNAYDVRARPGLAWVYTQQRDYALALQKIAEALVLDTSGTFRDRLLQKQVDILNLMARQNQQDHLLMANRISTAPAQALMSSHQKHPTAESRSV